MSPNWNESEPFEAPDYDPLEMQYRPAAARRQSPRGSGPVKVYLPDRKEAVAWALQARQEGLSTSAWVAHHVRRSLGLGRESTPAADRGEHEARLAKLEEIIAQLPEIVSRLPGAAGDDPGDSSVGPTSGVTGDTATRDTKGVPS